MKFCYQSVRYPNSPLTLEVTEAEIVGKAWGENYPYNYPRHISISEATLNAHSEATLNANDYCFASSTSVELPATETPIVTPKVTTGSNTKSPVSSTQAHELQAIRFKREQTRKMLTEIESKPVMCYF